MILEVLKFEVPRFGLARYEAHRLLMHLLSTSATVDRVGGTKKAALESLIKVKGIAEESQAKLVTGPRMGRKKIFVKNLAEIIVKTSELQLEVLLNSLNDHISETGTEEGWEHDSYYEDTIGSHRNALNSIATAMREQFRWPPYNADARENEAHHLRYRMAKLPWLGNLALALPMFVGAIKFKLPWVEKAPLQDTADGQYPGASRQLRIAYISQTILDKSLPVLVSGSRANVFDFNAAKHETKKMYDLFVSIREMLVEHGSPRPFFGSAPILHTGLDLLNEGIAPNFTTPYHTITGNECEEPPDWDETYALRFSRDLAEAKLFIAGFANSLAEAKSQGDTVTQIVNITGQLRITAGTLGKTIERREAQKAALAIAPPVTQAEPARDGGIDDLAFPDYHALGPRGTPQRDTAAVNKLQSRLATRPIRR